MLVRPLEVRLFTGNLSVGPYIRHTHTNPQSAAMTITKLGAFRLIIVTTRLTRVIVSVLAYVV